MRFLDQEVTEAEITIIEKIFDNMSYVSAKTLTEEERQNYDRLVERELIQRRDIASAGIYYVLSPQVIGAYFTIRGKRAQAP